MDTQTVGAFSTSPTTEKLDAALAKAQGAFSTAAKSKVNPHFKSKYADLAAVWEACREALSTNGVSVTQWPIHSTDSRVHLVTRLAVAGEWMMAEFSIPAGQPNAHGYGSAITYLKRFSLAAALGIAADEDDDGNAAVGGKPETLGQAMVGDSWEEWANGEPKKSDCALWCNRAYNDMRELVSVEDIDRWLALAENKKRIRALHDYNEERYDKLMKMVNKRRDELQAREAA